MKVQEIMVKSCITKSKLTDYVINPYTGCQHGCAYCYADFIRKFQNIPEKWGEFVYAKINCPDLLKEELHKKKPGHIWISSVCDAYMPVEVKYKLTRKILKIINHSQYKNKFTYDILTKSDLVKRDFDLLSDLNAQLGCSINTLDIHVAKIIEPFASSPIERIRVLKDGQKENLKVYGFISPVLPGITNLEELFRELNFCEYVWVELLNTRRSIMQRFMPFIRRFFPNKVDDLLFSIDHPKEYYNLVESQVKDLEKKYRLKVRQIVNHGK